MMLPAIPIERPWKRFVMRPTLSPPPSRNADHRDPDADFELDTVLSRQSRKQHQTSRCPPAPWSCCRLELAAPATNRDGATAGAAEGG
eukprot:CAMPEP_0185305872 /NCGR_PEP_ID=MMETSP1363-20130426/15719_1 /TAXON_ID=38817 /ORGANISM="Gephyrocapsa oceanica, Strain RCC1303" /LENGTH=87 /DNA_ID=CAMNT_0027903133 /DNA_START=289 /DNA_END=548 /DNA_ORIENTATION=+